jgi:methylated-DNA-protein-cysteine methyltransferase related protein
MARRLGGPPAAPARSGRYERIYDVVRAIPRGRVATYGLVAMLAGHPRAARFAGLAMHHCDDPTVPCHRVVNASGGLAPHFVSQRARLRREGVTFAGRNVELRRHLWSPRLPDERGVAASRRRGVAGPAG